MDTVPHQKDRRRREPGAKLLHLLGMDSKELNQNLLRTTTQRVRFQGQPQNNECSHDLLGHRDYKGEKRSTRPLPEKAIRLSSGRFSVAEGGGNCTLHIRKLIPPFSSEPPLEKARVIPPPPSSRSHASSMHLQPGSELSSSSHTVL